MRQRGGRSGLPRDARLSVLLTALAAALVALSFFSTATAAAAPDAGAVARAVGAPRGVVVVAQDVAFALDLARQGELTVLVQAAGADAADAARRQAAEAGLLGTRIFVEEAGPGRLHVADGLADAVVAGSATPRDEALRAVRPRGTVFLGDDTFTRPVPEGTDDWSHHYHGPDNNPQSQDTLARSPYLTQFVAQPRYGPAPQAAVASGGRLFMAFGHVAWHKREEPWLNTLVAVSGANGSMLWTRPLAQGFMVDRCTMIAKGDVLYLGTPDACLRLDAATGRELGRIAVPQDLTDGPFWKWMALDGGILYALVGRAEPPDADARWARNAHGWPWGEISGGYNQNEYAWGFAPTLFALDPQTGKVLWHHREDAPIDSRTLCMKAGRIFFGHFGKYLACLDARTGKAVWRRTAEADAAVFEQIGPYRPGHGYIGGWKSTVYARCTDRALYLLGPQVNWLTALAAEDGRFLWKHEAKDLHMVIHDESVYVVGPQNSTGTTRQLDPMTGSTLAEYPVIRRACTRTTGGPDGIFFRAPGGSVRLDLASGKPQWISPMRPSCLVGVVISDGHLYWVPWTCDCNLQMFGVVCNGPAGAFGFAAPARDEDRLQTAPDAGRVAAFDASPADWPAYRASVRRDAATTAALPASARLLWERALGAASHPTAPVAAGGLAFVAGADGAVRALDAATGEPRWTAWTGGEIRYPPAVADGRVLVGSGDGWAYAFEAAGGRRLWRFRAAPAEQRISVYGGLVSRWPVATGVAVHDGVAYLAAGINNYDGTHVYALDAATGRLKWHNAASGHLDAFSRRGVAAQGDLLISGGRLFLAGGNAASPGVYDLADGRCHNPPVSTAGSQAPRGRELHAAGNGVAVSGQPLYSDAANPVFDQSVTWQPMVVRAAGGRLTLDEHDGAWTLAARPAEGDAVTWSAALPGMPVRWGVAVDRNSRVIVTLEDGRVMAYGAAQ